MPSLSLTFYSKTLFGLQNGYTACRKDNPRCDGVYSCFVFFAMFLPLVPVQQPKYSIAFTTTTSIADEINYILNLLSLRSSIFLAERPRME